MLDIALPSQTEKDLRVWITPSLHPSIQCQKSYFDLPPII